jgi:hypothetical protein
MATKVVLTFRETQRVIAAFYRAEDWTRESIMSLRGTTDPSDRVELASERATLKRYARLRRSLERHLARHPQRG